MRFLATDRRRGAAALNMTPLLDVMFLLVIFVLVSARFEPETGIDVDLPAGSAESAPSRPAVLRLTLDAEGKLYLDDREVPMGQLEARLAEARRGMDDPVLLIRADKTAAWDRVARVTDTAARIGQTKINFQTRR